MKNGFTLIELLGVIVILGILGMIAFTAVDRNVDNGIYKTCLAQEKVLKEAAKSYSIDYPDFSGDITVEELEDNGYLKKNMENPATGETYRSKNTSVKISYNGSKYTYSIIYVNTNEKCENYKVR